MERISTAVIQRPNHTVFPVMAEQADRCGGQCEAAALDRIETTPAGDQDRQEMPMGEDRSGLAFDVS